MADWFSKLIVGAANDICPHTIVPTTLFIKSCLAKLTFDLPSDQVSLSELKSSVRVAR
jgi:hypothetical protein